MKKILLVLTVWIGTALAAVSTYAQITVEINNLPLTEALKKIEESSGYSFFYSNVLPDRDTPVSVRAHAKDITYVMDALLDGLDVSYEIKSDRQIALYARKTEENTPQSKARTVTGIVYDPDGLPVIGAGVVVAGSAYGTITDENGQWTLELPDGEDRKSVV